jgi:hypothetical protein
MKLSELNSEFLNSGGEGSLSQDENGDLVPAPLRVGVGVWMECPCGGCGIGLFIPFERPLDGGPPTHKKAWARTGDTLDTLTLRPSVLRKGNDSCGWHGWITNGEAVSC